MAQTLLAFELKPDTNAAVQEICTRLSIEKIDIAQRDYAQKLGYLAKVSGFAREKIAYTKGAFSSEMLVFSGMNSDQVDAFLAEYKQTGLPDIGLKAIVTMYNIFWTAEMLFHALRRERKA